MKAKSLKIDLKRAATLLGAIAIFSIAGLGCTANKSASPASPAEEAAGDRVFLVDGVRVSIPAGTVTGVPDVIIEAEAPNNSERGTVAASDAVSIQVLDAQSRSVFDPGALQKSFEVAIPYRGEVEKESLVLLVEVLPSRARLYLLPNEFAIDTENKLVIFSITQTHVRVLLSQLISTPDKPTTPPQEKQQASAPSFSLASGTYSSAQTLSMTSTTPGASIFYTIDGSTPTTSSTSYSTPISVSSSMTIKALATRSGWSASEITTAAYVIALNSNPLPTNPGSLLAAANSDSSLSLVWTAGGGGTSGYKIAWQTGATAPASCSEGTVIEAATINGALAYVIGGLSPETQYSFRVCSVNNYQPADVSSGVIVSASTDAIPADVVGPSLSVATVSAIGITPTGIELSWVKASDNVTAGGLIEYEVRQSTSNNIATVATAEANGSIIQAYTADIDALSVTGLSPSTTYYFSVIVKDQAGNKTSYTMLSQATAADTAGPTAGSFSASTSVTGEGFVLNWSAGSDDLTPTNELEYFVCSGASAAAIDTVAKCLAATSEMDYTANKLTLSVAGKAVSTTYFYNIVVKDAAGNTSIYNGLSQATSTDSTPPTSVVTTSAPFGPTTTAGSTTNITGTSSDNGSVSSVKVQIIKNEDPNSCLNIALTAFDGDCSVEDSFLEVTSGTTSWTLTVNDSLFEEGSSYKITSKAVDNAGNVETSLSNVTLTWWATPSAPSVSINTAGKAIELEWTPNSDAVGYLVVRRLGSAVSFTPVNGGIYKYTTDLGSDHYVVQVGSAENAVDYAVDAGPTYHYKVFAYSAGYAYATSNSVNAIAQEETFKGITRVFPLNGLGLTVAEYQRSGDCGLFPWNALGFDIFRASLSGSQNFLSPIASAANPCSESVKFTDPLTSESSFIVARSSDFADTNTREASINYSQGTAHAVLSSGMISGRDRTAVGSLASSQSLTVVSSDHWGNQLFLHDWTGSLIVMCAENLAAPYCRGRTIGKVYNISAPGVDLWTDGDFAAQSSLGSVQDVTADKHGNIYFADSQYHRIGAICFRTSSKTGFCSGKSSGRIYTVAGAGGIGDGGHDVSAIAAKIYLPGGTNYGGSSQDTHGITLDLYGNVYFGDYYTRVRAVCVRASVGAGFCADRTVGHLYRVAGTGTSGDGLGSVSAINTTAVEARIGRVFSVALDIHGNLFMGTGSNDKIRVVCFQVSSPGFCRSKNFGFIYWLTGNQGTGVNINNEVALNARLNHDPNGIAVDRHGNVFVVGDAMSNNYIRVICNIVSPGSGACEGKTVGNMYTLYNMSDTTWTYSLSMDRFDNLSISNGYQRKIITYCQNINAGVGFCAGASQGSLIDVITEGSETNLVDPHLNFSSAKSFAPDPWGNYYYASGSGAYINVLCNDPTNSVGICSGKTQGAAYRVIGTGTLGVGTSGQEASLFRVHGQYIAGFVSDHLGNLYFGLGSGSGSTARIFVYCNDTSAGHCAGSSAGFVYSLVGGGSLYANDSAPTAISIMRNGSSFSIDQNFNIYIGNNPSATSSRFLHVLCFDTSAGTGFCDGKPTPGNVYNLAGTGTAGDGGSDLPVGTSYPIQSATSVVVDLHLNVYFTSSTTSRVRVACFKVSAGTGFCEGKTVGHIYHLTVPGGLSSTSAIEVDQDLNIILFNGRFIDLICQVEAGRCSGKVIGNSYRLSGSTESFRRPHISGLPALNMAMGQASNSNGSNDKISIGPNNEIYVLGELGISWMIMP